MFKRAEVKAPVPFVRTFGRQVKILHSINKRHGHIPFQFRRARRPHIRLAGVESAQLGNTLPMAVRSTRPVSTQP